MVNRIIELAWFVTLLEMNSTRASFYKDLKLESVANKCKKVTLMKFEDSYLYGKFPNWEDK